MSEESAMAREVMAPERPVEESPGHRLRKTREAQGLSRAEVADQLRLNERLVTALEENDYDRLPPATFVIGYLRNYAKLLEIPAEPVVSAFEQWRESEEQPLVAQQRASEPQVKASDPPMRLVTYLVVFGLVGLLGVWWVTERQPPGEESAMAVEAPSEPSEPMLPPVEESPSPPATLEQVAQAEAREATPPAEAEPLAEPASNESPRPDESPRGTPVSVAEPVLTPVEPPAMIETPAEPVAVMPPPQLRTELRLEFQADCWTDVVDANGEQLVYDLVREGRTLVVQGAAPFQVFLGYAPGVEIHYQDGRFNHQRFIRGDTARFRVGSAADNRIME